MTVAAVPTPSAPPTAPLKSGVELRYVGPEGGAQAQTEAEREAVAELEREALAEAEAEREAVAVRDREEERDSVADTLLEGTALLEAVVYAFPHDVRSAKPAEPGEVMAPPT